GGSGGRYGSGFDSDAEERRYRREDNWYQEKEPVLEQERRRKESRKRAYRFRPGIFLRNILILLLILCAAAGCIFFALTSGLKTTDLDRSSLAIPEEAKSSLSDYQNIVILGSDARAGESYKGSRTDAIMILSINKKTGKAKMISVMRDSYLRFSGSNGQNVYEKVTHAFAYGGAENTLSALNRAMDLNISQYVLFNWKAVTDAVDSLGGVEIDVKADEVDDLNRNGDDTAKNVGGTYTPVTGAGNMLMDGVQATTYCRIRETSGGDVARGNRTKIVFEAILSKAMKNPLKLKSMMDTVLPELQTNFTKAELFKLALSSRKMDITENLSWPKSYYGGIVDGMWVAVPATLRENVIWLHKEAFGDSDYVPSDACTSLSESIIEESGHRTANN
ncbi:MAG: LCP family protein, partial [Eubacteriales bacterium]|nr:LCP family protein [Eubacteriales bacterium]